MTVHHFYALKFTQKREMSAYHLPMLPIVIEFGRAICDKPAHLTFFHFDDHIFGRWFQASVKRTDDGTELWVVTYHIASHKEVARMTRKYGMVRPEKSTTGD